MLISLADDISAAEVAPVASNINDESGLLILSSGIDISNLRSAPNFND